MSSARNRVFITETVGDPIPVVFFGGETPFKKALIAQLSSKKPDFIGISDSKLSQYQNIQPYRVIWVMSGEEDWESAVAYAKFTQVPLITVVFGKESERVSTQIEKKYTHTTTLELSHIPSSVHLEHFVSPVIEALFHGADLGGRETIHISLPQEGGEKQKYALKTPPQPQESIKKQVWRTEIEDEQYKERGVQPKQLPQAPEWKEQAPKLHHVQFDIPRRPEIRVMPIITPQVRVGRTPTLFSHLPFEKEIVKKQQTLMLEAQEQNDGISKTLERVFSLTSPRTKIKEKQTQVSLTNVKKTSRGVFTPLQRFVLSLGTVLLVCSVPVFSFFFLQSSFIHHTNTLYYSLQNPDVGTPLVQLESVSQSTKMFGLVIRSFSLVTDVVGLSTPLEKYKQAIELSNKGVSAVKSLTKLRVTLGRVYVASMQSGDEDPLELLAVANTQVEQASKDLALFSSELATVPENVPLLEKIQAKDIEQEVGSLRRSLVKTQHLLGVLPSMLGQEKKKTYLVLIQNPLELRASGGFLESFALVTVDKGRVLDIQVQDVIQADNILKGKIEPPADLKAQLGESQWFFRDSNWSTQFPLVAQQAEWFVQKELGRNVDGTIAINAYTLQDFLRVVGQVVIAGQQQEIVSADNIFERLFMKSESLFQGENSGKKGFLSSVSDQVFSQMQKLTLNKAEEIGVAVFKGLERGHILLSMRNKEDQQTLVLLGTTGAVMTPPCPQAFADNSCVVDTIYQVDANVGVNRANYALTRSFDHRVVLSQNAAAHTHVMHYSNTSTSTAWPSGSYRNYVRLVIPDFAQVNSVMVDKKLLSPSFITQNIQFGKREVGFQIEVPVGKTVEVQVNYVTMFSQSKKFSYALFTQKQAGTGDDPISYTLNVQKPLRTSKLAPEGAVLGNVVQFDTTLDRHQYLAVELQ